MKTRILERFNRGDLAQAYDLCLKEMAREPEDLWLRHRAVLCLARSGALERAQEDFVRYRLADATHDEDCLALGARLLKTRALELEGQAFRDMAVRSADHYARVFEETGGHYPAINAASMELLAGRREAARDWAKRVLEQCARDLPESAEEAYYQLASCAEAHLILGDAGAAHIALRCAIAKDPENYSAHVTTVRQMRLLLPELKLKAPWLDDLLPPRPAHFAGHLFEQGGRAGTVSSAAEHDLSARIDAALEAKGVGSIYGAVAAGADILFAEAGLRRGAELHVVLPVPVNVFIDASVRPLGGDWIRRCEDCLGAATSILEVTSDRMLLSELHLRFASEVAMGRARMRARILATDPVQILLSDGRDKTRSFGTAHDARIWAHAGLPQIVLPFDPALRFKPAGKLTTPTRSRSGFRQVMRAMLFLDVRGSSMIHDDRVPDFVSQVLRRLADACNALEPQPVHADSWGDGLFLAFETVTEAARAAHTLQQSFSEIDLAALDFPGELALRIGGHYGPVHEGEDPLQKRPTLFGSQVALASRIEGRAMPGSIFISEAFAVVLELSNVSAFRSEYVGETQLDPNLPAVPLYSLRVIGTAPSMARETSAQPA